jgi:hypothetical protein
MTKVDRWFAAYRDRAFTRPLTRAQPLPHDPLQLGGGVAVALTLNK